MSKTLYKGLSSPNVLCVCNKCLDIVKETLSQNRELQSSMISDTAIGPRNDINNTIKKRTYSQRRTIIIN